MRILYGHTSCAHLCQVHFIHVRVTLCPLVTFEDKRKENFDKGQAELDRRRQLLLEQQKKLEEERLAKERAEAEKRERKR